VAVGSVFALDTGLSSATPLPILSTTSSDPLNVLGTSAATSSAAQVVESLGPTTGDAASGGSGTSAPATTSSSIAVATNTNGLGGSTSPSQSASNSGAASSSTTSGSKTSYGGGFYTGTSKASTSVKVSGSGSAAGVDGRVSGATDAAGQLILGEDGLPIPQDSGADPAAQASSASSKAAPGLVPTAVPGPGLGLLMLCFAGVVAALAAVRRGHA
jgi:hypothetical protein